MEPNFQVVFINCTSKNDVMIKVRFKAFTANFTRLAPHYSG